MTIQSPLLLLALPALLLFPACEKRNVEESNQQASHRAEQDRREAEDNIHSRLDSLDAKIQRLREDARRETGPARAQLNRRIDELASRRSSLSEQLDKLRAAGRDAWGDLKRAVNQGVDELQKAYDQTESDLAGRK